MARKYNIPLREGGNVQHSMIGKMIFFFKIKAPMLVQKSLQLVLAKAKPPNFENLCCTFSFLVYRLTVIKIP